MDARRLCRPSCRRKHKLEARTFADAQRGRLCFAGYMQTAAKGPLALFAKYVPPGAKSVDVAERFSHP